MGLISISGPSDGQTIDAADVNTPLNTIANEINGNLDNSNIKSSAAIDASKLASGSITNTQLATSVSPVTRLSEGFIDYVGSGCVWSGDAYGSTRAASMTSGVVYLGGKRLTVSSVTARSFTASKDTYVDLSDNGDGTAAITYTEVTNNAASPSLAAGSLRLAIIVTGASNIANAGSVNQGQNDKVLPIASSVPYTKTDSLGNVICNRNPVGGLIGYRYVAVAHTPVTGTYTYPELVCPVIVPANRQIKVTAKVTFGETNTSSNNFSIVYVREDGTNITSIAKDGIGYNSGTAAATNATSPTAIVYRDPSSGLHTYGAAIYLQGKDMTVNAGWISVELV